MHFEVQVRDASTRVAGVTDCADLLTAQHLLPGAHGARVKMREDELDLAIRVQEHNRVAAPAVVARSDHPGVDRRVNRRAARCPDIYAGMATRAAVSWVAVEAEDGAVQDGCGRQMPFARIGPFDGRDSRRGLVTLRHE